MGHGDEFLIDVEIDELEDLRKRLARWSKTPAYPQKGNGSKKTLTQVVKTAAGKVHKEITHYVPVRTGDLKEGLIIHRERSRSSAKIVYDLMPDPQKNYIFQKPIVNPVLSTRPHGYYPASQEYGFFTRRPGGGMEYTRPVTGEIKKMDKVPGKYFMLGGAEASAKAVEEEIIGCVLGDVIQDLGG